MKKSLLEPDLYLLKATMWCTILNCLTKYLFSVQHTMQTSSWFLLFRAMLLIQKTLHNGMKSLYPVLVLTFLLSTAYCDDSPLVNDDASFATENGIITDIDVQGKYDTETSDSPLSKSTTNDFVSEAVSTVFTSSLTKNGVFKSANKPSTFSSNIAGNDNTAITYPITQTAINVDDRITTRYTLISEQTKKLENDHTSTAQPTTPMPVDACDTDQVEVSNSPVLINAFTNEINCNLLVTAPNDTSISVKLRHSSLSNATTYFYVEKLGNLSQNCADRYILVSVDFAPCIAMIRGGQFRFNFQNTEITLEMHTIDVQISSCFETHIDALESVQCNSTSYATKIGKQIETFEYNYYVSNEYSSGSIWDYRTLSVRVIHYLARCTCDCSDNCICTLGQREWLSMCTDGKDSNTHAELIVYDRIVSGLSFANTGINEIQQNVLSGFEMLEVLILGHNSLSILPATICQNLPQLKVLKLGYNVLSNLTFDLFTGQCELKLLYIHLNNNKLTYLAPDVFNSTSNLQHLDLSQNRLVHISNHSFRTLTELHTLNLTGNYISYLGISVFDSQTKLYRLYLSDNVIALNQSGVFDSLGELDILDLSDNHISVLPTGVFGSLRQLRTLDLSDNHVSVLPTFVFNSLVRLRTLDLSDNHISVLPTGATVFEWLRTLDLLPTGVFDAVGWLRTHDLSDMESVLPPGLFRALFTLGPHDLLPTGVFDSVGWLHTLDMSDNHISVLPVGVFDSVGWLRTLDLSDNHISVLPRDVFNSLDYLRTLDLSDNHISVLPVGVFDKLFVGDVQLLTLDLHANNISTLHVDMFKSPTDSCDLHSLNMSHNVIYHVPSDVFKSLKKLKSLDLSHNAIEVIDSNLFTSQEDLLTLDLSSNNLTVLPAESVSALKNLISLKLCSNNLVIISSKTLGTLTALRVLDLSKNRIINFLQPMFSSTTNLLSLDVSGNDMKSIRIQCFGNLSQLTYLNLSKNFLSRLPSFSAQRRLQVLDLSENRLVKLTPSMFNTLGNLTFLSLCKNDLVTLPGRILYHTNNLLFLNVSHNAIQQVDPKIFSKKNKLQTLDMRGNEMSKVTYDSFTEPQNAKIVVDKYATCCFMDEAQCVALKPRPEYLTCNRMLRDVFLRISVWILGISAFICNGIAFFVRSRKRQANKVQTLFITNLALSDLLMGVNMLILASADVYYGEYLPSQVHLWRHGFPCKLAGFLSIFSSEGSVFFIVLISIDRMLGIKYPLGGGIRVNAKWARIFVALAWLTAFLISVIPIGLVTDRGNVFSISEVCIGIPIVRRHLSTYTAESVQVNIEFTTTRYTYKVEKLKWWRDGKYRYLEYRYVSGVEVEQQQSVRNISYDVADITGSQIAPVFSIVVFIGVNLTCFLIVAFCYMYIFIKANETSEGAGRTLDRDEQIRMAKKMFAIVFTDFCCWIPLGFICILAQCSVLEISPEMYAWTVGFILPINSSINPFLYVLYEAISDHRKKKKEEKDDRENIEMQVRWKPITHFGLKFDQEW